MSYDFASDWSFAKTRFELATDKKKPGKKFLGAIKMSSGIEKACKSMEKAIMQPSGDRILKAEKEFDKAVKDYLKVLRKAADDEDATDRYKEALKILEDALNTIRENFSTAKREETTDLPTAFIDIVTEDIINALAKSTYPASEAAKAFATKTAFRLSGVDGRTKLQGAADAQAHAALSLKQYIKAMKAIKDQAKVRMERKEAWKMASDLFGDAVEAVHTNGMQMALAYWKNAQQQAFADAGKRDDFGAWLEHGPLTPVLKELGDLCNTERERLAGFENQCTLNERKPK